jgi:host factor-I protein
MESGSHADDSSLNIQNEYFNTARKNRTRVTVVLTTGQRISGQIRSFDRFTLILDTRHGDQMVFKHAITTVSPSHTADREQRGRPHRTGAGDRGDSRHRPGGRPHRGGGSSGGDRSRPEVRQQTSSGPDGKSFGNFMDLSAVSSGDAKGAPGGAATGKPAAKAEGDSKPAAKAEGDSKPAAKAEGDSKPAAKAEGDSKPATKAEGDSKPAGTEPVSRS